MSNAEQAWKEYQEFTKANGFDEPHEQSFMAGFIAGVGDAMELPEVRAEELVMGEWYLGKNILINKWDVFQHDQNTAFTIQYAVEQFSFRGPLPLGGGE